MSSKDKDTAAVPKQAASASTPTTTSTEGPWDATNAAQFEGKMHSEYFDPCQEVASKSLKCLHRNGGKREMCSDYFQAYRDCKKQWMNERKEAKRIAAKPWFGS